MTSVKSKNHSDMARWVVIYPVYLNSKKTAEEGRKIPKSLAIEDPTCQEIFDIVQNSGFSSTFERKMHPREPERDNMMLQGRIRVQLKNDDGTAKRSDVATRQQLFRFIAELIPKLKTRQPGAQVAAPAVASASGGGGGQGGNKKNKKKR